MERFIGILADWQGTRRDEDFARDVLGISASYWWRVKHGERDVSTRLAARILELRPDLESAYCAYLRERARHAA